MANVAEVSIALWECSSRVPQNAPRPAAPEADRRSRLCDKPLRAGDGGLEFRVSSKGLRPAFWNVPVD